MAERRAENSEVAGSNPARSTRVSWFATFGERGTRGFPLPAHPFFRAGPFSDRHDCCHRGDRRSFSGQLDTHPGVSKPGQRMRSVKPPALPSQVRSLPSGPWGLSSAGRARVLLDARSSGQCRQAPPSSLALVAQADRAPACEAGGRRFKPSRGHQMLTLAGGLRLAGSRADHPHNKKENADG
jgi:hypothetical protein